MLATTLASTICVVYYFPPVGSLAVRNLNDMSRLAAFATEGILTSILMEGLHRARARSEENHREAEAFREKAERSEVQLRAILDNTGAFIYLKNLDYSYILANRTFETAFRTATGAVVGKSDHDFFPIDVAEVLRQNDRDVLGEVRAIEFEETVPLKDGIHTYMSLKFPLCDPGGVPFAIGGVSTDITPLKEAQGRALQAERLAAIGQMVTGLAHESGNALQRGQACLELLALRVHDRPEALGLVAAGLEAQEDLRRLYEEVRCYAAPIVLDRRICPLRDLLRQAWGHLEPARTGRDARLVELGDPGLTCVGDEFRLIQVFRNILDNALSACRDPVVIESSWSMNAAGMGEAPSIEIILRDNGPGLTDEQRTNLFEPFYTTKTHGTGLGMAIVRRIVEAHDGRIAVGPEDGQGAAIHITLPGVSR
jgi:two-component system sensor kinase FixL